MPGSAGPSRRDPLRLRLTAGICGVGAVVGSLIVLVMSIRGVRGELMRQGTAQARQLAVLLQPPLAAGQPERAASLLAALRAASDVVEVTVVDASQRIVASSAPELVGHEAPAAYRLGPEAREVAAFAPGEAPAGEEAMLFVAPIAAPERPGSRVPARAGAVALRLSTARTAEALRALIPFNLGAALIGVAALAAAAYGVLGMLLRPVGVVQRAIDSLAEGRRGTRVDPPRLGPLAGVGVALNRLAETHEAIARRALATTGGLQAVIERVVDAARQTEAEIDVQQRAVDESAADLARSDGSIRRIMAAIGGVSEATGEVSSAVLELGSSIDEVGRSMDALNAAVESSSASSGEMAASVQRVAASAEGVRAAAEKTALATVEIDSAIRQVGASVEEASRLSRLARASAEQGAAAVTATVEGSRETRTLALQAKGVLERLAGRSAEIAEALGVIRSINEEANLLSLNAAIIAAQAGEHGRAFAVVAGHVKTLAGRTAASTREIETLIGAMQTESVDATAAMEAAIASVEAGVDRSRLAGEALAAIRGAASDAHARVAEIIERAAEQGRSSQHVAEAARSTSDLVEKISAAMREQARASAGVLETAQRALEVSREVRRAAEQQRGAGRTITRSVGSIDERMRAILEDATAHAELSRSVSGTVERVFATARRGSERIGALVGSVEELRADSEALRDEIARLYREEGGAAGGVRAAEAARRALGWEPAGS
jgi:methyl-accepting chemotaxis protein